MQSLEKEPARATLDAQCTRHEYKDPLTPEKRLQVCKKSALYIDYISGIRYTSYTTLL